MQKELLDSKYHVPNLKKALEIIEFMAQHQKSFSAVEVAQELKFSNNSVFRILNTLHLMGYLIRDSKSKRYRLSRKLLFLGYSALNQSTIIEQSVDLLRELRDATRETALIGTLVEEQGMVLYQVPSTHSIKFLVDPGTRFPLYTSAPGKVFLAYLPELERDALIDEIKFIKYTKNTISSKKELLECLQETKEQGFAVDYAEEIEGLHCVSAPVLDYQSRPCAAVWITAPKDRLSMKEITKTAEIVKDYALRLSARFGFEENIF